MECFFLVWEDDDPTTNGLSASQTLTLKKYDDLMKDRCQHADHR